MTMTQMKKRLDDLERTVKELAAKVDRGPGPDGPWWEEEIGRCDREPLLAKVLEEGRRYRQSRKPKRAKRR